MYLFLLLTVSNTVSNAITIVSCLIILGIGMYYGQKLYHIYKKFISKYKKIGLDYEKEFNKDVLYESLLSEYKKNLFTVNEKQRTNIYSDEYFNIENIFSYLDINPKHITSAAGMLVGLGVLGTFLGLTMGIVGFDSSSTNEIQKSIDSLLGGMGTAFLTSLVGMTCSSIFIWLEKRIINQVEIIINRICLQFDNKYYISDIDLMTNFLSFKDEYNNTVYISNAVRDIYQESHKQTGYIGSLVDDLSDAIDDKLSNSMKNDVLPLITRFSEILNDKIDSLKASMRSPAEGLANSVVDELKEGFEVIMDKFNDGLSGSAKSEMEHLSTNLSIASNALSDLPNQMTNMVSQLNTSFGGIHDTINDLQNAVEKIVKGSVDTNKDILDKANAQYTEMSKNNNKITSQADALILNFNNMVETLNETTSQIQGSMVQIKEVKDAIGSLIMNLSGAAVNVQNATSTFKDSQLQFVNDVRSIQNKNADTISDITSLFSESSTLVHEYAEEFNTIKEGLSNIFEQIKKGLDQYSTTVSSDAQSVLNGYSLSLNEGVKALQQSISSLSDLATGLTDAIEDFKKGK